MEVFHDWLDTKAQTVRHYGRVTDLVYHGVQYSNVSLFAKREFNNTWLSER